jgi:Ca-activated chloride channel homolog
MVSTALWARTSLAVAAAGAAIVAALLLGQRAPSCTLVGETSDIISARLASTKIERGATDQDIAVTIRMPGNGEAARPPLSLAVVIDRSGSMNGPPLRNARRAAAQLVDELRPDDAFTIVTYSSGDETVVPMSRATAANKAVAHDAIERITDDGGTCISCGLTRGAGELAHTPIVGGLRRIVLISDGQANEGIWDRDELAQLASDTAARGVSISSVGVGLDFDEQTMIRLAQVGHGNYYFVEDTANLGAMFGQEMDGLAATVATDVELVVRPEAGTNIDAAYGYPIRHDRGAVIIPVADLRFGETRKVVLHAQLAAGELGGLAVGRFELHWRDPSSSAAQRAQTTLVTEVIDDPRAVARTIDRDALSAIEEARTSRVIEDASIVYEKQGYQAAQKVLERHVEDLRAAGKLTPRIEHAAQKAMNGFADEPAAKATKSSRGAAFELAH